MRVAFEQTFEVDERPLLRLTIPGNPFAAKRARSQPGGGRPYTPGAYRAKLEEIAWLYRIQHSGEPVTDFLVMDVAFVMANRRWVDQDNLHKTLMDAGNHVVWADDHQFIGGQWAICYDPGDPRTDLSVWRLIGEAA